MIKPGSIVAIKPFIPNDNRIYVKWLPVCDEKTPYIVRDVLHFNNTKIPAAVFEEGIIGYHPDGVELNIGFEHLVELLPPEDISEEIRKIQENYQVLKF